MCRQICFLEKNKIITFASIVQPLRVEDLAGKDDDENNDGQVVMSKIKMYLSQKNLPHPALRHRGTSQHRLHWPFVQRHE